jgi:hypothetical protein
MNWIWEPIKTAMLLELCHGPFRSSLLPTWLHFDSEVGCHSKSVLRSPPGSLLGSAQLRPELEVDPQDELGDLHAGGPNNEKLLDRSKPSLYFFVALCTFSMSCFFEAQRGCERRPVLQANHENP